jgi:hypothetical protein
LRLRFEKIFINCRWPLLSLPQGAGWVEFDSDFIVISRYFQFLDTTEPVLAAALNSCNCARYECLESAKIHSLSSAPQVMKIPPDRASRDWHRQTICRTFCNFRLLSVQDIREAARHPLDNRRVIAFNPDDF